MLDRDKTYSAIDNIIYDVIEVYQTFYDEYSFAEIEGRAAAIDKIMKYLDEQGIFTKK